MKFMISLPDPLFERLRTQAEASHRVPRQQAEWLLTKVLRGHEGTATPPAVPRTPDRHQEPSDERR